MCGIAGWYRVESGVVDRNVVDAQCAALRHRGPDDSGVLIDGDFGFGMRRLSIIDVVGGHQPIQTEDGRYAIIFNGEIYNHLLLRRQLLAEGRRFATMSDTETILCGFAQWGHDVWQKLEGMFAVAIWDRRDRTLHLARDPMGIKPLYLAACDGGIAFASEMKGLFPVPGVSFAPDDRAVHDFFSFGHVLPPRTIYSGVWQLDPGRVLSIGKDGSATRRRFWQLRFSRNDDPSEAEWIEAFRAQWRATIERHLLSDVPVGAFLSGGVDSSAVVAAMSRAVGEPIKAFTIGFSNPHFDETPYARQIAAHLGCEHVFQQVEIDHAAEVLPRIATCYDEPFADPSAVPTWYLSRLAAEHVKVVLSGDGGDELFAGYTRHRNEKLVERFESLPALIQSIGGVVNWIPPLPVGRANDTRQRLQKLWREARLPDAFSRFFSKTCVASPQLLRSLYSSDYSERVKLEDDYSSLKLEYFGADRDLPNDAVEQFLYADTTIRLPSVMLTKVDRASMAHSLEVRVPFLSHEMVDWAARLPVHLKLRGRVGKYIVRRAIEPWLPPGILDRPKQGFSIPLADWFRGDLGSYAQAVWHDSGAGRSGYLDTASVQQLFEDHRDGKRDHAPFLYALAIFSLWWAQRPEAS